QYCETSTSSLMKAGLALLGGAGLGAGLLYLLDPEKGQQRRRGIARGASNLGHSLSEGAGSLASSAADYAGSAWSSLRGAAGSAGDYASDAGDYLGDKYNRARAMFNRDMVVESRSHHRTEMTICSLGSMVLGATLMYLLDPVMGRSRRGQITGYARSAGDSVRSAGQSVADYAKSASQSVSDYTRKATDAVRNVTGMAKSDTDTTSGLSGTVCPP